MPAFIIIPILMVALFISDGSAKSLATDSRAKQDAPKGLQSNPTKLDSTKNDSTAPKEAESNSTKPGSTKPKPKEVERNSTKTDSTTKPTPANSKETESSSTKTTPKEVESSSTKTDSTKLDSTKTHPTPNFSSIDYAAFSGDVIKEVRFKGLLHISSLMAASIVGIHKGDRIDRKKLSDSIKELYAQGYFEDIYISYKDGVLTYMTKEKPRVAKLKIWGYGTQKERTNILSLMPIKTGDVFSQASIKKTKEVIRIYLEQKGFYGSVVQEELREVTPGAYLIRFNINRGSPIYITYVDYNGRKKLSARKIEKLTANKERDFLGWMWGFNNGKLHLNELEYDPLRVRDAYMRAGFLDAKVSKPFLSANFSDYKASLYYDIKEGARYRVSGIRFIQEKDVISDKILKKHLKTRVKDYFDIEKVRKDAQAIKLKIADKGYAFVEVTPDLNKDEQNHTTEVLFRIKPGKKVYIHDVIIAGNRKTQDRVIRREILLGPGNLYGLKKLARSQNALRRLGYFDEVNIDQKRLSDNSMDIIVNVKEGKTGELMFGLGYGSYDGIMVNASAKERNIFGTGQSGSIYLDISGLRQTYNISLTNPRVFNSRFSLSANVFKQDYSNYDYDEKSVGFGLTVGREITESLSFNVSYVFSQTRVSDFDNPDYLPYFPNRAMIRSSISPSFSFDNTDDYYFPKNGIIASASVEYDGLGGDMKYTKLYGKFAGYYSLKEALRVDLIFRYKMQIGYIFDNGYLPITDTFYMGGVNSVRGFKDSSISPRGPNGVRIGGDSMMTNAIELSYGIFPAAKMRLAIYYDFGMLGDKKTPFTKLIRQSWGFDVEWVSPVGPIVLVFPVQIFGASKDDETSKFEFSMGTRF